MNRTTYQKILSANDTGDTGTHQAGILIPKSETGLLGMLPQLDASVYNPSSYLTVQGSDGDRFQLRFIYYNNKLHGRGTRNEYRLTCLTDFLRRNRSRPGDAFRITRDENGCYSMEIIKDQPQALESSDLPEVIRLRGWSRVC
jgi:Restriction endonuclease EcoRII, N-terminal